MTSTDFQILQRKTQFNAGLILLILQQTQVRLEALKAQLAARK